MKDRKKLLIIIGSIIILLVIIGISIFLIIKKDNLNSNDTEENNNILGKVNIKEDNEPINLVKKNVVKVINKVNDNKIVGTGFFIEEGYLVTNSHVVDIKGDITIEDSNGNTSGAILISNDIKSDVAILSVDEINSLALSFGNTLDINITDDLYAVGYALNLDGEASVTKGILSARRSIAGVEYLQTDAAINSGFSGGPLLNAKGEVIGMNSLANDNATIGMSISIETLENIIDKLLNEKEVNYLTSDRPTNALSSVLKEVGYEIDDLYNEWEYFHKGEKKETTDKAEETVSSSSSRQLGTNAELKYLGVKGYDIGWGVEEDAVKFQIYYENNEDKLDLIITPKDNNATYRVKDNENLSSKNDGTITIVVTSEDGNHKKEYYIVYHNVKKYIEGLSSISTSSNIMKSHITNTNVLYFSYSFLDNDNLSINGYYRIESFDIELYACPSGTSCTDKEEYILLKKYSLPFKTNPYNYYYIELSEIKEMLNSSNYFVDGKSMIYTKSTVVTLSQGSFSADGGFITISQ